MNGQAKRGREFSLTLDNITYKIVIDGNSVLVNGQPFIVGFEDEKVLVDGTAYDIKLEAQEAIVGGIAYDLSIEGLKEEKAGPRAAPATVSTEGAVTAIMPGKIIRVMVAQGDEVAEGDVVCILEAMKMENELKAPRAGLVKALYAAPGQDVEAGAVLAEIE
jgi:biotin carboxyl carrier protein